MENRTRLLEGRATTKSPELRKTGRNRFLTLARFFSPKRNGHRRLSHQEMRPAPELSAFLEVFLIKAKTSKKHSFESPEVVIFQEILRKTWEDNGFVFPSVSGKDHKEKRLWKSQ